MRVLSTAARTGLTTALFIAAIAAGSLIGAVSPPAGTALSAGVDPLILALVGVLFFTIRIDGVPALRRAPRTALIAIAVNFGVVPLIALALTGLLPDALRWGVLLYLLAPCTDWLLGFTRLAGGDTAVGASLIPLQLALQLLLFPIWLALFTGQQVATTLGEAGPALLTWFVLPAVSGVGLRLAVHLLLPPSVRASVVTAADRTVPIVIAALIVCIFAGNIDAILAEPGYFAWVLPVVVAFFALTLLVSEAASRIFGLSGPEHVLLTMTASARNAPLMLAVTTVALPDEPVAHAAIVLGMLIEFPHLTLMTHLLRRRRSPFGTRRPRRPAGVDGTSFADENHYQ